jgi:ribosomal protein L32
MDALISVFARIEPQLNFRPGSDEPEDRAAVDVSRRAIDVIEDEVDIRVWRQILATWVGFTGIGWLETGYDPSPQWGTKFMQTMECPMCGYSSLDEQVCPDCGSPTQPSMDETGQPQGQQVPIGKMYVDVPNIFEMYYDYSVPLWKLQRRYIREKAVEVDEAKERWPEIADQITPNATDGGSTYVLDLPLTGPPIDENQTGRLTGTGRGQNTKVTEKWMWELPSATYPDGLLAIIVGQNLTAFAGPLPYRFSRPLDDQGTRRYFLPTVCFPQKIVPGTGSAKTVADDLASKQSQRNRWESCIEACGMRMGSPIWLRPKGANVSNLTGDPGSVVDYTAVGPGAAKPERIPGQPIPVAMIEFVDRIDKTFEELAATFDVIKGSRPEGVSAGIALQILQERNLSRYGPLFILWESAWAEWAQQALEIFREFATEERLLRIQGRDGKWQVEKFMGADLDGHVDVIADAGSSNPRSTLLDKAEVEQLAAMGIIDLRDPEVKFQVLELYGRTNFTPSMALDTKNSIMENEAFENLAKNPAMLQAVPEDLQAAQTMDYLSLSKFFQDKYQIALPKVRPSIDEHSIHAREHRSKAKAESFNAWPPMVQTLLEKHAEYHQQLLTAQAQALQGQAGPGVSVPGGFMQAPPAMRGASGAAAMQGQMREMADSVTQGGIHTTVK